MAFAVIPPLRYLLEISVYCVAAVCQGAWP